MPLVTDMVIGTDKNKLNVKTLLDTGTLQGNYGSLALASRLRALGFDARRGHGEVCSAFGDCRPVLDIFELWLYVNKPNKPFTKIPLLINIIDITPHFELIVGNPLIREYDLLDSANTTCSKQQCTHTQCCRDMRWKAKSLHLVDRWGM